MVLLPLPRLAFGRAGVSHAKLSVAGNVVNVASRAWAAGAAL
jgi:hypothetical protein